MSFPLSTIQVKWNDREDIYSQIFTYRSSLTCSFEGDYGFIQYIIKARIRTSIMLFDISDEMRINVCSFTDIPNDQLWVSRVQFELIILHVT